MFTDLSMRLIPPIHQYKHIARHFAVLLIVVLIEAGCILPSDASPVSNSAEPRQMSDTMNSLIPMPVSTEQSGGEFVLSDAANIYVPPDDTEVAAIGQYLADKLNPSTGFDVQVRVSQGAADSGNITLSIKSDADLGEEGYTLTITEDGIALSAHQPAGLFRGVQTIRQLLPAAVESASPQPGPWRVPTGTIRDFPRFAWRGMMLDVARHFFSVEDVKRVIDLTAYYKMNRFHIHLSDDQGWRIMINAWPDLALIGGSTEGGGSEGGYYTQAEYTEIVAYAQARYIVVVPEIDVPGHTNAALAAYAELNCDDVARELYIRYEVGFSSLCVDKDITYQFLDDVIGELAAITPGPYLHIGGDEARATSREDYLRFMECVREIVQAHGKVMVGWEEIAQIDLPPTTIAQHWNTDPAQIEADRAPNVIMSPAGHAYLDMKYEPSSPLGLDWAGLINVEKSYSWDPATLLRDISEDRIMGIEAPLWSETLETIDDIEYLMFPRLAGLAEIGWSPAAGRGWDEYRMRLATHGPRLRAMGVNFYASPEVDWE
jgi:hexosaminidase